MAYYFKASTLVKEERVKEALIALEKAIKINNEYRELALKNPDFAGIRQTRKFQKLVKSK